MKNLLRYSIVFFVLTIILLLIIPLPAALVDVAIILNMSLSMMILVITMTIREPLEFSIFPIPFAYHHIVSSGNQCIHHKKYPDQFRIFRTGDTGIR